MMPDKHLGSLANTLDQPAELISNAKPFYLEQLKRQLSKATTPEEIEEIRRTTDTDVRLQAYLLCDEALDRVLSQMMLVGSLSHDRLYEIFQSAPRNTSNLRSLLISSGLIEKICLKKIQTAKTFSDIYQIHLTCPSTRYCRKARLQIDRAIYKIGITTFDQLSAAELHLLSKFYKYDNNFSKEIKKAISSSAVIRDRFNSELNLATGLDDYAKLHEQYSSCGKYFDDIINGRILDYCVAALARDSSKDYAWELYLKCPPDRSAREYIVRNFLIKS